MHSLPACDTHDTTALELGDLADDRSDGSGRGGDEHRVADVRLPNIEQPEISRQPSDAEK